LSREEGRGKHTKGKWASIWKNLNEKKYEERKGCTKGETLKDCRIEEARGNSVDLPESGENAAIQSKREQVGCRKGKFAPKGEIS